jgi:hypothetical protein
MAISITSTPLFSEAVRWLLRLLARVPEHSGSPTAEVSSAPQPPVVTMGGGGCCTNFGAELDFLRDALPTLMSNALYAADAVMLVYKRLSCPRKVRWRLFWSIMVMLRTLMQAK